jgi:serine/threonine protein kinase
VPLLGEDPKRPTYRILEQLGGGPASDEVFLAWHEVFQGPCVQKTVWLDGLEDALASNEPAFLDKLHHPHIVEAREAQFDPKGERAITFVMRYYAGGSIEEALREGYAFSIYRAVELSIHTLEALAYVKQHFSAIHRDVKPGNVVLDEKRRNAFVSDFGSAATLDRSGMAAAVLGTDHYRPPEAKSTGRVGHGADLFAVGMTLFEMLNGRLQWETHDLAAIEARLQAGRRALPDATLSRYAPHVPARLRRLVNKAIARQPEGRFASAEDFIRALARAKLKSINWRRDDGEGLVGTWVGTWPPHRAEAKRTTYVVTSRLLGAGRDRGKLRLESDYRTTSASWRQVTGDVTVEPDDRAEVEAYFASVEVRAAQREPTR